MKNDKYEKIAGYLIVFSTLAFPLIMSIYSIIKYKSLFGFIFFTLMVDVIIMVIISIALNNKLDKISELINKQTELVQSEFAKTRNLIIQRSNK